MTEPPDPTADALLDATLHVLAQKGLKGATTRAIAEAAGVNEVTLFRRYGNKTGLIRAAIERRSGALREGSVRYSGDLEADLLRIAEGYQGALRQVGPVIRVIVTEFPRHPELGIVLDGPRQLFTEIGGLLARYQAQGQLRPEPLPSLLLAFVGPLVLPYIVSDLGTLLAGQPVPPPDARTHVEHFLRGRAAGGKR